MVKKGSLHMPWGRTSGGRRPHRSFLLDSLGYEKVEALNLKSRIGFGSWNRERGYTYRVKCWKKWNSVVKVRVRSWKRKKQEHMTLCSVHSLWHLELCFSPNSLFYLIVTKIQSHEKMEVESDSRSNWKKSNTSSDRYRIFYSTVFS